MSHTYRKLIRNQKGVTMLEILIAIAILALMVGPFLSVFVYSAKVNTISKNTTDATYTAQECMENMYDLSNTASTKVFNNTRTKLVSDGYTEENLDPIFNYKKVIDGFYVLIKIDKSAYPSYSLYTVVVTVYTDAGYTELGAKMEDILNWK